MQRFIQKVRSTFRTICSKSRINILYRVILLETKVKMEKRSYLAVATLALVIGLIAATAPKFIFSEKKHLETLGPSEEGYTKESCAIEGCVDEDSRFVGEASQKNLDNLAIIVSIPLVLALASYLGIRRIFSGQSF